MNYEITDAALAFVRTLRSASIEDLQKALYSLANRTNSSAYAYTHEPFNGVSEAVAAEIRRRDWDNRDNETTNEEE